MRIEITPIAMPRTGWRSGRGCARPPPRKGVISTKAAATARRTAWKSALRCSTLPWPNGWPASAGVPANRMVHAFTPLTSASVAESTAAARSAADPVATWPAILSAARPIETAMATRAGRSRGAGVARDFRTMRAMGGIMPCREKAGRRYRGRPGPGARGRFATDARVPVIMRADAPSLAIIGHCPRMGGSSPSCSGS